MAVRSITLSGSPLEMGRQYGEELYDEVRAMIQTRLDLTAEAAHRARSRFGLEWCLGLAAECVPALQRYSLPVFQELTGVAEAADLTLPEMIVGNGWTDFKDLMAVRVHAQTPEEEVDECTSLVIGGNLTADGRTYFAQTWDMNVTAGPYLVLVRREPVHGPRTISLTTAGCLSLIGLNEHGLAVGNTNLAPRDARPGVFYLAMIHHALSREAFEDAIESITTAQRMSGHYYYVGGRYGEFMGIETTATAHELVLPALGTYVHTNHYREPRLIGLGLTTPEGSNSLSRQTRMSELAAALEPGVTVETIISLLTDHKSPNPICRHSDQPSGAATLGAAVICPQTRQMWVTAGNPCQNGFECFSLAEECDAQETERVEASEA